MLGNSAGVGQVAVVVVAVDRGAGGHRARRRHHLCRRAWALG